MFGSCNKVSEINTPAILFDEMKQQDSDVFVWLGDASYVDNRVLPMIWRPNTPEMVKHKFDIAFNDPPYARFRQEKTILGVYDDHDINMNDADYTNPTKEFARQYFLDFLQEEPDSERRKNPNGIYTSYYIGDERVKLILLDTRFNRNHQTGDTLGESQWIWLEKELEDDKPLVFFIGSGVQVLPDDRFTESILPYSKRKLFEIIQRKNKKVIFLSGDIHIAEIMKAPCSEEYFGYPLYEITSSGLHQPKLNRFLQELFYSHFTNTYNTQSDRYLELNYCKISIEWEDSKENILHSQIIIDIFGAGDIQNPKLRKIILLKELYSSDNKVKHIQEYWKQCPQMKQHRKIRLYKHLLYLFIGGNKLYSQIAIGLTIGNVLLLFILYKILQKIKNKYSKKQKQQ